MTSKSLAYINADDSLYRTARLHRAIRELANFRTLELKPWFTPLWLTYAVQTGELIPDDITRDELLCEIARQQADLPRYAMISDDDVDFIYVAAMAIDFRAWYKTMRKTQPPGWRERL